MSNFRFGPATDYRLVTVQPHRPSKQILSPCWLPSTRLGGTSFNEYRLRARLERLLRENHESWIATV